MDGLRRPEIGRVISAASSWDLKLDMSIQVHGKQLDLGEALRNRTLAEVNETVAKYFNGSVSGLVTFSREAHWFRCDGTFHLSSGMTLQASAQAGDAHAAFDGALAKLEKRLRRYGRRLKNHHAEQRHPIEALAAPAYVIEDRDETDIAETESLEPVIVAEMTAEVKSLTVGEAVMQMNLSEQPALLFRNRGNGRLNLVYRRSDGNIGWIDPPEPAPAATKIA